MILKTTSPWPHDSKHGGQQCAAEAKDCEQSPCQCPASGLVWFFLGIFALFLSSISFTNSATETDTSNTRSLPDTKQREITTDETKAYLSSLITKSKSEATSRVQPVR